MAPHLPTPDTEPAALAQPSLDDAAHEPQQGEQSGNHSGSAIRRHRRIWALALGTTAAIWQLDPALTEMAEMVTLIACAGNKSMAKDAIMQLRTKAGQLRTRIEPLQASALTKVVRRAEAACGAVLDKGVRVKEVQASWDHFMACVRARQESGRR